MHPAHPHLFLPATLALAGLIAGGCKPANTFVPPPPPEVTVQQPERGNPVVWIGAPGRVESRDFLEIRARVSGYLKQVAFVDGQRVNAGDPLFIIEPEPYIADWEAAKAHHAEAQAAADLALVNYQRREQAYETRAISEIDKLTAKANLDAATAQVRAAQAALDQAWIKLTYTTNTAPASGRISRRLVGEGNLVDGSQATLLATLTVEDPVHVYFDISERQAVASMSRAGSVEDALEKLPPVRLELADGSQYGKEGRIDYIDTILNPETGTLKGRAVFDNTEGKLVPGLYGKVLIPNTKTNALLVPDLALGRDLSGSYLLAVRSASNVVESVPVTAGDRVGQSRIIESGLRGDERIIVNGLQRARPGLTVTPIEATR